MRWRQLTAYKTALFHLLPRSSPAFIASHGHLLSVPCHTSLNTLFGLLHLTFLFLKSVAMDPNLNSQPKDQPDELPPSAKLQAGYIRYIRIKPEEGPDGEICFETAFAGRSLEVTITSITIQRNYTTPRSRMRGAMPRLGILS
jgi:hypothetical protein